ncbi:MAG: rRNA maturation RNase YbeY [Bacteroidota bacterium]
MGTDREYRSWLQRSIGLMGYKAVNLVYVFVSDEYLLGLNREYLGHDSFTDIITFDYVQGMDLSGDIFISVRRVEENAMKFKVTFEMEIRRVMAHGLLHLMGYGDKTEEQTRLMRIAEEKMMKLFHVEQ